jgi:hypothetical protein
MLPKKMSAFADKFLDKLKSLNSSDLGSNWLNEEKELPSRVFQKTQDNSNRCVKKPQRKEGNFCEASMRRIRRENSDE